MTTAIRPHTAAIDLNNLRRGHMYRATTRTGQISVGEYLGIEVAYDVWCILLRGEAGTESIPTRDLSLVETHLKVA